MIIWLWGRPASGKSTVAKQLNQRLENSLNLDGDILRSLIGNYSYTRKGGCFQLRKVQEKCKQLHMLYSYVIVSMVTPYHEMRVANRKEFRVYPYLEVKIEASLDTCIKRDPKGMYSKALNFEIENFTGVTDYFDENAENTDLICNTEKNDIEQTVKSILSYC